MSIAAESECRTISELELVKLYAGLPKRVDDALGRFKCVVAGGYVRDTLAGLRPSDIDIFVHEEESAANVANFVFNGLKKVSGQSHHGDVDGKKVQVIHKWTFKTANDLFDRFDFRCCQGALRRLKDGRNWYVCKDGFREDVDARKLVYTKSNRDSVNAANSVMRAMKFTARGWKIDADCITRMLADVVHDTFVELMSHGEKELGGLYSHLRPKVAKGVYD